MKHAEFVHLHVHTQYSLLDGAIRLEDLFQMAKSYRMPALAITDHGNMFGTIYFYRQAFSAGIKPIIGCEVYVAPDRRSDRTLRPGTEPYYHLILLVKNFRGYCNLLRLVTSGYVEGFYYRPRVDKELLQQHNQGLIALSACLQGEVTRHVLEGSMRRARQVAGELSEIFNYGRFYLELQKNGMPEQEKANRGLLKLSGDLSLPVVATNDCHYLRKEDAKAHEILLCIQTGKTMDDQDRMRFPTDQFYFKSPEEMIALFADIPNATKNTLSIAEQCNLEIDFNTTHLPFYALERGETLESRLNREAETGLEERLTALRQQYGDAFHDREQSYRNRLKEELQIICRMGYAGYFLIVADFIQYARSRNIPVGPGRGSGAGSLVAYALKITNLDPIPYGLLFERFLNPERVSMPDFDIDFCKDGRDEVIAYVAKKYGENRVAQITTFGTMQARAAIRDVGRALNMSYPEVDRIAKMVPSAIHMTLDKAVQVEPRLRDAEKENPRVRELLTIARVLEGLQRHASTHAAGVVIADKEIVEYTPLYRGNNGELVTQYDMKSLEKVGLVKFDFLGLRTLTVMEDTVRLIQQKTGKRLSIDEIPLDDEKTYALLASGQTNGIFQLESSGMKEIMIKLQPENFHDLIALVALYRPGPLQSGMVDDFIDRKHGKKEITYEIPMLEELLRDTYGVIVYQEQVMKIASVVADFSLGDADILRRAMGKKIPEEMASQREKFLQGAQKKGIEKGKAERIFDLMTHFAGYGFNKSHSAAYALIAHQTSYLKAHYPVEFMAAMLTSEKDNTDKMIRYLAECRDMGIQVLPPDINESDSEFTVNGDRIRFGLTAVKNVGSGALSTIFAARKDGGPFRSFYDFCERVDLRHVNRRVLESLIKCGAFDSTGAHRSQLMAVLDDAMEKAQAFQRDRQNGQISMFASFSKNRKDPDDKLMLIDVEEWSENQRLDFEKEALGLYISGHPLQPYQKEIQRLSSCDTSTLSEALDGQTIKLVAMAGAVKTKIDRRGDRMAFVTLEDLKGSVETIVYAREFNKVCTFLENGVPLLVEARVDASGEGGIKLIASEIIPLNEAMKREATAVHIKELEENFNRKIAVRIKEIISQNPGKCQTIIHLVCPQEWEGIISLGDAFRVSPDESVIQQLRRSLESSGSVWLA